MKITVRLLSPKLVDNGTTLEFHFDNSKWGQASPAVRNSMVWEKFGEWLLQDLDLEVSDEDQAKILKQKPTITKQANLG